MKGKQKTLFLILALIVLLPALPAAAVILNSGESTIFTFDFGSAPLASAFAIDYYIYVTSPTGGSFGPWTGEWSLYDELGEAAVSSMNSGFFSSPFSILNLPSFQPGLFDDPVSYIEVIFFHGPASSDTSANFEIIAKARFSESDPIEVNGVPAGVPEPATLILVGLGLVGLAGARRTFRQ